jgi:hypothetical protein
LSSQVSGRISGIRPLPDIRYPAFGLAGYPAKIVSGASLPKTYGMNYVFNLAGHPAEYPTIFSIPYPARYLAVKSGVQPDTGYQRRPDIRCIPTFFNSKILCFIKILAFTRAILKILNMLADFS